MTNNRSYYNDGGARRAFGYPTEPTGREQNGSGFRIEPPQVDFAKIAQGFVEFTLKDQLNIPKNSAGR